MKTDQVKSTKTAEYMVLNKIKIPRFELLVGDTKIKHVWKFKYLGSILADDRKCHTENRTKGREQKCYVIAVFRYDWMLDNLFHEVTTWGKYTKDRETEK